MFLKLYSSPVVDQTPSVSVIIPTIDGIAQTRRAVQSALRQTLPVMEVIVVNDGTPHPLTEQGLGDGDPRVRVIRLPNNLGAAAARQAGAERARGDFLAFLDSDDIWFPHKLHCQFACFYSSGGGTALKAVACGWSTTGGVARTEKTRIPIPSSSVLDFLSGCWFCPGTTLLLPRETFSLIGPFFVELSRLEDLDWSIRFALEGGRLLVAPIIGAKIQPSGRARFAQVSDAAAIIAARYNADPRLSLVARRRLSAYLALEKAAAAKAERDYLGACRYLARSLLLKPRLSIPLRHWWHK